MNIDPGRLNRLITIEKRSQAPGAFGQEQDQWTPVVPPVWANIKPLGGSERIAAAAMQGSLSHTILVRYHALLMPPVLAAQRRIVYGARTFDILAARDVDEARSWIIFDCREGGADGH